MLSKWDLPEPLSLEIGQEAQATSVSPDELGKVLLYVAATLHDRAKEERRSKTQFGHFFRTACPNRNELPTF